VQLRSALGLGATASLWLAGCAAMTLAGCAAVGPPPDGRPILRALHFEGNDQLSTKDLGNGIATTPSAGFFKRVLRTWDEDVFEIDRQRLLAIYRQRGFLEARVDPPRVAEQPDGAVVVTVPIREGRRTHVAEVVLEGLEDLTPRLRERLAEKLPLRTGQEFDEALYDRSKSALEQLLKERAYAAVEVVGEVQLSVEEATARVTLRTKLGPRYLFGRVIVSGNRLIPTELIERATGLTRDLPFAPSLLDLAQQRVYNLGVFSGARVSLEPLGDHPVAAVRVSVREAPFHTVRVGLGMKLEQDRVEVPRLLLEYAHRNLFGGVRRLELSSQLGWAFTPTITAPQKTGLTTLSSAQLTLPEALWVFDVVGRAQFARELQTGFDYDQLSARLALQLRQGKLSLAAGFNFVRTFNARLGLDLSSLVSRGGAAAAALSNCVPACSLPYPELRLTFDARNDAVQPRRGFYFSGGLSRTLPGTSFDYWRIDPEIRAYFALGSLGVLAARAQWGALIQPPSADSLATPFNQRFFGGGQTSQRGYGPQQQGPRLGASPDAEGYATVATPVGGNGLVLASVELRLKTDFLLQNSLIVPFVDASRVSDSWEIPFTQPLEIAPGLGLRYLTPFGPVRFDVAVILNPEVVVARAAGPGLLATPVGAGCSQAHCIGLSRGTFHLTLGEAF
jgi:translocation and assembly module TamA